MNTAKYKNQGVQIIRKAFLLLSLLGFLDLNIQAQDNTTVYTLMTNCDFTIQVNLEHPKCFGSQDGRITLQVDNAPNDVIQYNWIGLSTANNTNEAEDLGSGTYMVVVSDAICSDSLSFTLLDPDELIAPDLDTTFCGSASLNLLQGVSGGTGPLNFSAFSINGSINCTTCPNAAVTIEEFSVIQMTIVDQNGCTVTRTIIVDFYDPLTFNIQTSDETCNENGSIEVNVSGGSGDYLYALNNSGTYQNSNIFNDLSGDSDYQIKVLDLAGCTINASANVGYAPDFSIPDLATIPVSCFGANDGQVAVTVTTDGGDIKYAIDDPTNTEDFPDDPVFDQLTPGSHTVYIIEDSGNCINGYDFSITEPDSISIDSSYVMDPSCPEEEDGEIELFVSGGNGGYSYSMDADPNSSTGLFTDLGAGVYTIKITDELGCEKDSTFLLEEPETPDLGAETTPSCPDEHSGSIVIVEAGKLLIGDFLFSLDSMSWQTENHFEGLPPGLYKIYVEYPDGCVFEVWANVEVASAPDLQLALQHVSCPDGSDGSATVSLSSTTPEDDYLFGLDSLVLGPETTFTGLTADDYWLYVEDTLGCLFFFPFTIEAPEEPDIELLSNSTTCHGDSDGHITIQINGGNAPFEYSLDGGAFQSVAEFTGLPAGGYVIICKDSLNCLFPNGINVPEPAPLDANLTIVNETCSDENGLILSLPSGGNPPYQFEWSTGDSIAAVTELPSALYSLTITDSKFCELISEAFVENEPGPILLGETTDVHCSGASSGAIDLTVLEGTAPFHFSWSNGLYTEDLTDLEAGSYVVTVYDAYQCTNTKSYTVHEPPPLELSYQTGQDGDLWFINLIVEGGLPPYEYEWSTGETSQDIFNLDPGLYTATITDDLGCSREVRVEVGLTATQEPAWAKGITVYPVPARDRVFIGRPGGLPGPGGSIHLLTTTGSLLSEHSPLEASATGIPVEHLAAGVYILRLEWRGEICFKKMLKN